MDKKALIGEILSEIVSDARSGRGAETLRIGLMSVGSEHASNDDAGQGELVRAASLAMSLDKSIEVVMIGPKKISDTGLAWIETGDCEADISNGLNDAIASNRVAGAVALHYPFPLGVTTIGRVVTPLRGKEMLIASTTGASATDRVEAMARNALYGVAVAKSLGIANPTVGILNVDGAPSVNRILRKLVESGVDIRFGESVRLDGGSLLRGNDILAGAVDVCVTDTLTGNILMKLFSSWNNGGTYETTGYGYGPSVGEGWERTISIISRASGAPVIANAILYTATALRGNVQANVKKELDAVLRAGFKEMFETQHKTPGASEPVAPPSEPTDEEIHGVDVLSIDDAVHAVWAAGIYAEASMGCTGPVVKVPGHALERAKEAMTAAGFL